MQTLPFGHHMLHNRYRFKGNIVLETPLRLSSGVASNTTDAPLMRTRDGRPYIPGSSLRGALRSELERILAAVGADAGIKACVLFSENTVCLTGNSARIKELGQEKDDKKVAAEVEKGLCDICKLFGSPVYASRLVVADAYPSESGELLQEQAQVRDCVGIDRDTGSARDGVKFDYEVLEPSDGLRFAFDMQVENLDGKDRSILNLLLALLQQGLYVGGKRAGGLGKISLEKDGTVTCIDRDSLKRALETGILQERTVEWADALKPEVGAC